jgi:hypothetical protein
LTGGSVGGGCPGRSRYRQRRARHRPPPRARDADIQPVRGAEPPRRGDRHNPARQASRFGSSRAAPTPSRVWEARQVGNARAEIDRRPLWRCGSDRRLGRRRRIRATRLAEPGLAVRKPFRLQLGRSTRAPTRATFPVRSPSPSMTEAAPAASRPERIASRNSRSSGNRSGSAAARSSATKTPGPQTAHSIGIKPDRIAGPMSSGGTHAPRRLPSRAAQPHDDRRAAFATG